jgi:hypothetical protein
MRFPTLVRRRLRAAGRRRREVRMFAAAMRHKTRPVVAQIVPMRRCNLACAYCNEFDHSSSPVPLPEMLARIDRLATLGVSIITISGGEPLLHPQLDEIIRGIRSHGAIATLISNAYLMSPERIRALNAAGLDYLQISIDNVEPDDVSMKSLRVLERKLEWLARDAEFPVTINSVLGIAVRHPQDALTVARRARSLGFHSTVGIAHDGGGQSQALPEHQLRIYQDSRRMETGVTRPYCVHQECRRFGELASARKQPRQRFAAPEFATDLFGFRCPILPLTNTAYWNNLIPGATDISFCDDLDTFPASSAAFEEKFRTLLRELRDLLLRMRNHSTPVLLYPRIAAAEIREAHSVLSRELDARSYRILPEDELDPVPHVVNCDVGVLLLGARYDETNRRLATRSTAQESHS